MKWRAWRALAACALAVSVTTQATAQSTQYTYDALGRVVSAIDANGKTVSYSYDGAGNRTRVSNGAEFAEILPTALSTSSTASGVTGLTTANALRDGVFNSLSSIHVTNVETGPWVMADLGSVQNVNHIVVAAAIEPTTGAGLADLNDTAVEYSQDGTTWRTAATIEGIAPNATRTVAVGGVALRYLRIHRLASGRVALGDLRLYSSAAANTPLIANPDTVTSTGSAVTFDPRTNDQDQDGFAIAVSTVDPPVHGTAVVNAGASITYTPNPGYFGADSFLYTVTDGHNGSASAMVTVSVQSATNHSPVANNDQFNVGDRISTVVDGVTSLRPLNNDLDPDGDVLTITGTSAPAHGTVSVVGSGLVQYQANVGFTGNDSFTYTISDGRGGSSTATIAITTSNSSPVAVQDDITTPLNQGVTFDPRLNDRDPNGDAITVASITAPTNGTAVVNGDQTITYTPNLNVAGVDTFTYRLNDARGANATGVIHVSVSGASPPNAIYDVITASAATPVTFDPRANDTDPQNRPLTVISVSTPGHGTAVVNADSTVTYTASAGYNGPDTFNYTIGNDQGATASGPVYVNQLAVEYLVVGGGGMGGPGSGGVGGNTGSAGAGAGGGGVLQGATALPPTGSLAVTVGAGGFFGNAGSSSLGSVATALGGQGYASSASTASGAGGSAYFSVGVLPPGAGTAGQGFRGGDAKGFSCFNCTFPGLPGGGGGAGGPGKSPPNSAIAGDGGSGVVSSISGTPTTYGAGGSGGGTTGSTTTAPGAVSASGGRGASPAQSGELTGGPGAPNTGGGGGGGGYTSDTEDTGSGGAGGSGVVILRYPGTPKASGGTITQVGGYTIHTFTVSGTFGVTSVDHPPTAVNDTLTAQSGAPAYIDPTVNDADPDGDALRVIKVNAPSHGTVALSPGPLPVVYTSTLGYAGPDAFTYTITDGQGYFATATVNVTVNGGVGTVDYLVVGGGGGGGGNGPGQFNYTGGGGGGGGQVKTGSFSIPTGSIAITVGGGGAAGVGSDCCSPTSGANGGISSIGGFVSALGGGGGAPTFAPATSAAGNGGGGLPGGKSSVGGFAGGNNFSGYDLSGNMGGGGGGGAGAGGVGANGQCIGLGKGGPGVASAISGANQTYAAGGGGGGGVPNSPCRASPGGDSSAGAGGVSAPSGRGGGGGGGNVSSASNGGAGGSGVVILRYPTGSMTTTGGTVTTSGGYTIVTFTSSGTVSATALQPPVAVNDNFSASPGVPRTFDPRTNDSDPSGYPITITSVSTPAHGTVSIGSGGTSITYTMASGSSGSDSFTYTISDATGLTATATVNVAFNPGVSVNYLVVAGGGGGGGGGSLAGGGGGGGGLLSGNLTVTGRSYAVAVGGGGFAGWLNGESGNGGNSSFANIVANGGGGGSIYGGGAGHIGGSGGGGSRGPGGAGTPSQGNAGGDDPAGWAAGGGGGAGGPGSTNGGAGLNLSITGSVVNYSAGGGGGRGGASGGPSGGIGYGFSDEDGNPIPVGSGVPNTGGGGGGGGSSGWAGPIYAGAPGGSGVVIIRYPTGSMTATGGTITTSGGYTIHTFTSNGTFAVQ